MTTLEKMHFRRFSKARLVWGEERRVRSDDLYEQYLEWADGDGGFGASVRVAPLTRREFGMLMTAAGAGRVKGDGGVIVYAGVGELGEEWVRRQVSKDTEEMKQAKRKRARDLAREQEAAKKEAWKARWEKGYTP